ncbi:MAG: ketopantoate reductase family protein [Dehalococcoidales bacterium]
MKVLVIGAGAIGALVAGYLAEQGVAVTLTGRNRDVAAVRSRGLTIEGVRGKKNIQVDVAEKAEENCDLVVLAVKTQDLSSALDSNVQDLTNTTFLTVQNGVKAEEILAGKVPRENIASSIVMFGSTYLEPGRVVHNFEGDWVIGKPFSTCDEGILKSIAEQLSVAFSVRITEKINGMKWLKLFLNMNNCLPALTGKSMQETFSHHGIACLSIRLLCEALKVVDRAGIELAPLPEFPVERLRGLAGMPLEESGKVFSQMMINLSREPLYGSILQSIKRERNSEIDYFNGEIVRLGDKIGTGAPLNQKMVEMVHRVEGSGRFIGETEILNETGGLK